MTMIHLRKTEGLKRRNILLFLTVMAFMFLISMNSLTVHAETYVVSGKCGDNLTYSLNLDTGALSITGSGMMNSSQSWSAYATSIRTVEIGENVASIGSDAFAGCTRLESISIPANVSSIGSSAFYNCTTLKRVEIPHSVVRLGDYAFRGCVKLAALEIPDSVTSVGMGAFYGCGALASMRLPAGLTELSNSLFYECVNLKSVSVPDGVTSIGSGAFYNCHSLEDISIPSKVTSIGSNAFYNCSGLTGIVIPSAVKSIGGSAFEYCTSLKSMVVPYSVTTIGNGAFYGCGKLSDIYYRGSENDWKAVSIGSKNEPLTLASIHYDFSGTVCSHQKIKTEAVEASCTEEGNIAYWYCEVCGKYYSDAAGIGEIAVEETIVLANGHDTDYRTAKAATCITDGNIPYWHCNVCDKYFRDEECTDEISEAQTIEKATGIHDLTHHPAEAASCIADGTMEYWTCSICGKYFSDGNAESEIEAEETITERTGHSMDAGTVSKAAACEEKGTMDYTCTVCNEKHTEDIPALGHDYSEEWTIDCEATCTENGEKSRHCTREGCEAVSERTAIVAEGHTFSAWEVKTEPTSTSEGMEERKCIVCGEMESRTIDKISGGKEEPCAHTYQISVTPATTKANGSVTETCSKCGDEKSRTVIYAVKTAALSKTSYTYNGKAQKPSVTVKDSRGKALINNVDYTVSFPKGMKNVGRYTVPVVLKGNYSGTISETFDIVPKGTSISKVTAKKKGFTLKWKKQKKQTTGYEIAYSASSKFAKKSTKIIKAGKSGAPSKTVSKLKEKKKYYVRIRTYKTVKISGKSVKLYSDWSKTKAVITKK